MRCRPPSASRARAAAVADADHHAGGPVHGGVWGETKNWRAAPRAPHAATTWASMPMTTDVLFLHERGEVREAGRGVFVHAGCP